MKTTIMSILICCISFLCLAQAKNYTWKHYDILSAGIDVPDFFTAGKMGGSDVYIFENNVSNDISLSVECLVPNATFTPGDIEAYHDDNNHYFDNITYDYQKGNIFVMSGIDKAGKIHYIKGIKQGTSYYQLNLSYNKKYQYLFDKTLSKISASFK